MTASSPYGSPSSLGSLANGSDYGFEYVTSKSLLSEIALDPSGDDIVLLDVSYTSEAVDTFETRDTITNTSTGVLHALSVSGNELTVTDPDGDVMVYAHSGSSPHFLDYIESRTDSSDRDSATNGCWRQDFDIDTDTYLVNDRRLLTALTGASDWASPVTTDWHQWTYLATGTAADDDPRLRNRVRTHTLHDPSTTTATFTETWAYGGTLTGTAGDDQFPSEHEDFDDVVRKTTWNGAGQLTESLIEDVKIASDDTTPAYDIVSQWDYDSNGRLEETVSPDRYTAGTVHANTVNTFNSTSTSLDYGYLTKREHQDDTGGLTGPWREYEYDAFGNVSLERTPNRKSGSDNETEYTYDELDRVIAVLEPEVTLERYSSSPTIRHESETDYDELGGFAISQARRSYFNENGVRGTGQNNANPEWLETDYSYDPDSFRLELVESDFEYDGGLERTRQETKYDLEGRVTETLRFHSSGGSTDDKHIREERHYDAAGRLLLREIDPDDNATGGEDAYEWWYRYDGLGRVVVAFTPENSKSLKDDTRTGAVTEYDVYGRVTKQSSGLVRLDPTNTATTHTGNVEEYWTKPFYDTGAWRAGGSDKMYATNTQLSEVRYDFDEAGRVKATRTWYAGASTAKQISYAPVDLFPGGAAERRYVPWEVGGTADWDLYTESFQDDHNRVVGQQSVDDSGTTKQVWWKTERIYDNTSGGDRTGWMTQTKRTDHDEVAATDLVFTTDYSHDELGRVVERAEKGTSASVQRHHLTRFNGMGQVYESFYADDVEGSFTENGVIQRTLYNLAGRPVDQQRGFTLTGARSWSTTEYDLLGRAVSRTLKDYNTTGALPDRVYSTSYDDLGRMTEQSDPRFAGATPEVTYSYGHTTDGYPFVDQTDPLGRTARTLRNEAGKVLAQTHDENASSGLGGADEIRFTYGEGCGCSGSGLPVTAQTFDGTTELTKVARTYSPLGQVLTETITVDQVVMDTDFEYDAAGRRLNLEYPNVPIEDELRSLLEYSHRSDGHVTEMTLTPAEGALDGQTDLPLASFQYVGQRTSEATIKELKSGGGGADYAVIGYGYDALGRLVEKDFDLSAFSTSSGQFPSFTDEIDEFDLDGRVLVRKEPPRTASQTGDTYSVFTYQGAGWLKSQEWGRTLSGGSYSGGTTQDFSVNAFGESTQLTETVVDSSVTAEQQFGGNTYSSTIPYDRTSSNGLLEKIPDSSATDDHYQAITFSECASPEPGSQYADLHWFERDPAYNNMGQMTSLKETIRQYVSCAEELCETGNQTQETELRFENEWTYTYDVWGRLVEADQERWRNTGSQAGCVTQVGTLTNEAYNTRTDEWVYDAYGRVVKTSLPVQRSSRLESDEYTASIRLYHAYDGGMRIFSTDDDSYVPTSTMVTNHLDTFREVFRDPNSGQTLKFRNYRSDMGPSGASEWPGNTTVGETYGTVLTGILGDVLISNGNHDGDSTVANEDLMMGASNMYGLTGGYIRQPLQEEALDEEEEARDRSDDLTGGDSGPLGPVASGDGDTMVGPDGTIFRKYYVMDPITGGYWIKWLPVGEVWVGTLTQPPQPTRCCCPVNVEISVVGQVDRPGSYGHQIKITYQCSWKSEVGGTDCKMEWWEKATSLPRRYRDAGLRPNQWHEMFSQPFVQRNRSPRNAYTQHLRNLSSQEWANGDPVSVTDTPHVDRRMAERIAQFEIRLISGCPSCKDKKDTAVQYIFNVSDTRAANGAPRLRFETRPTEIYTSTGNSTSRTRWSGPGE